MSDKLARLFGRFDKDVAAFANTARLSCPSGCGDCCDHADTEVTEVEAELIAGHILREAHNIEGRLCRAIADPDRVECVFYDAVKDLHCTIYPVRPLICRAFGYSAYSDRSRNKLFAICPSMPLSQKTGGVMQVLFKPYPPVVEQYTAEIEAINRDERGGVKRRPLGEAVTRALGDRNR